MPIYEYSCTSCGKRFEVRARIGEAPKEPKCPGCEGCGKRVFSPPFIQFKGSGFHVNDYGAGKTGEES